MRNKFLLICLIIPAMGFAQVSPGGAESGAQQKQPLLSRLRGAEPASNRQQLQQESIQVAQPANTGGYRPGVTYPQQQQQQRQPQQQQYPQPGYPAYPPQQIQQQPQYNLQQSGARATPTPTPKAVQSTSSNSSRETSRAAGSSSQKNDSDDDKKESSKAKSSGSDSSSKSSKSTSRSTKSSKDDKNKSSSSSSSSSNDDDDNGSDNKSTSKSSKSSALEKIVKNVESGKSDKKEDSDDKQEEAAEVKKTEEEIAAEKARAVALKAADEATTVVAGFLKQANDGYYSKASESLAPAIKKYFESEISAVNGTQKTVLDELTANGTINMVTYINTTVRGEGAVVEAELGYGDGRTTRRAFDLVNIDDDWKIVLPVIEDPSAPRPAASTASTPISQTAASDATPIPAAAPPTAEQAASRGPLVLVPPLTNPGSLATTAPVQ